MATPVSRLHFTSWILTSRTHTWKQSMRSAVSSRTMIGTIMMFFSLTSCVLVVVVKLFCAATFYRWGGQVHKLFGASFLRMLWHMYRKIFKLVDSSPSCSRNKKGCNSIFELQCSNAYWLQPPSVMWHLFGKKKSATAFHKRSPLQTYGDPAGPGVNLDNWASKKRTEHNSSSSSSCLFSNIIIIIEFYSAIRS